MSHLVPLGHLYAIDSVVGLTLLSALFVKPTLLAMAGLTIVLVRRAVSPGPEIPGSPTDRGLAAGPPHTPVVSLRKDPA